MKTLNNILLLLFAFCFFNQLSTKTIAQPSHENQGFLSFDGTDNPPVDNWDREDPNLIFWTYFDLSVGISFNNFNSWGLPNEISANYSQIDNQTTACMNDWDSYMCIDQFNCFNMGYNLTGNSVQLEFRTEPQFFTNVETTLATSRLAVIEDNDAYYFKLYNQFSLTNTQQTQIYFNNCEDFDHDWTVAESYDQGKIPIKAVILHEMGHVLGLGHNDWGPGTLVMFDGLWNAEGRLLFHLNTYNNWDKIGIDAYWIHQGFQDPATELEVNPISRYLNRQHFLFDYEPEILFYSQKKILSEETDKENTNQSKSHYSNIKLFVKPENNKKGDVK